MTLTTPQYIYLGAVICYLVFFALFLRLFWWKHYAESNYWRRRPSVTKDGLVQRAHEAGQPLPRFSIVVPARNEADVIERTVEHMATLQYPPDLYEVVVVTDEKERLSARVRHDNAVKVAAAALSKGYENGGGRPPETEADGLVLGLLGALALEGFDQVRRRLGRSESMYLLQMIPGVLLRPMVWEASDRLLQHRGRRVERHLLRLLRIRLPGASEDDLQREYAALLSLAIPAAVAFCNLRGGDGRALGHRLAVLAARAHHSLTREIIQSMCDALAADLMVRLEETCRTGRLEERLATVYLEIYPTTQDIMERKLPEMAARTGVPALKHVEVPRDFDGTLGGRCLGVEVPSTKGRALNWALAYLDGRTTWCGFYDAESRPDPRVMLHVAHRLLEERAQDAEPPRIFQGPVFQVRNWYEMGPFCKIASLYQAIAHDWYLPALFRRLPFVGGTNLFVEAKLVRDIGGYDASSLTEDLELGTRAYLRAGAWPEYLPYPSSEQTPPTFAGFYRQRLRWATGHLQVMAKVRGATNCDEAKRHKLLRQLWWKGQGEWIFYQTATLVPPVIITLWAFGLVDPNVLGPFWHLAMNLLSTVYLGFTIYAFFRYLEHLDKAARPRNWLGQMGALAQLLVLPLAAFLFPVPYSSALVLSSLGRGPSAWVKTPRTRE
ncbi:MAG TPA: glycosyltransferase family 2 protein [Symbiobacteriaceae bacterium]|jgi:cellulose synthase/poly-beta-1,6-N-acetylglucosamine synthase-like glycosyltransferase